MRNPDLTTLEIPRAKKGEAAPVTQAEDRRRPVLAEVPRPIAEPEPQPINAGERQGAPAFAAEARPAEAPPAEMRVPVAEADAFDVPPPEAEPRTTVSVRLTLPLQERLRIAAFRSRRRKQDIVEAAVDEYLSKRGC